MTSQDRFLHGRKDIDDVKEAISQFVEVEEWAAVRDASFRAYEVTGRGKMASLYLPSNGIYS